MPAGSTGEMTNKTHLHPFIILLQSDQVLFAQLFPLLCTLQFMLQVADVLVSLHKPVLDFLAITLIVLCF